MKTLATTLFALVVCAMPFTARAATFTGLGFLPDGPDESLAQGVSADGTVVVGRGKFASGQNEAFRWTAASGMIGLEALPSNVPASFAYGVSSNGSVVVGQSSGAFIWTAAGGMVGVGGNLFNSVSASGTIAVGITAPSGIVQAAKWTQASGFVGLGFLPGGARSEAHDISSDGSTIVGISDSSLGGSAFRWTQATGIIDLGPEPGGGHNSQANGVSADGSAIVGNFSGEAFRWTAATGMVGLGDLSGGHNSQADAVSGDGSIVVGKTDVGAITQAFIWDEAHGMQSLQDLLTNTYGIDLTGWTLQEAHDISTDGRTIVGEAIDPDGHLQAFVTVIPEPSTATLLGLGVLAFVSYTARRRFGNHAQIGL